jgi:hypothetical protein
METEETIPNSKLFAVKYFVAKNAKTVAVIAITAAVTAAVVMKTQSANDEKDD